MGFFEGIDRGMVNLSTMMRRLGIDVDALAMEAEGTVMTAVMRTCGACSHREACRYFLERAGSRLEVAPAFCPNRERFRTTARLRAREAA